MKNIRMKKLVLVFVWLVLVVTAYGEGPIVELETNFGNIAIELYDADAPVTVANFLTYVKSGFYDGLIFHRVIDNFMIQTGSFDAGLNRRTPNDPIPSEYYNGLQNKRGTLAMALTSKLDGEPNRISATSGFYINLVDNAHLDVNYTVFGQVISDMNVVDRIAHLPTVSDLPQPPGPVIIYNAKILGDLDKDSDVDLRDYGVFAGQWLDSGYSDPFKITDGNTGDWFGYSVAVDANHAIIGAPGDSGYTGAAYIFESNDGIWTQKAKFTAFDGGQ
ncbi:MAG: peptidylprolyl isomerase, partial [Phycisphaerae bacterium]